MTKLAVIEDKLDGLAELKKVAYEADNRSKKNTEDIDKIDERLTWISRLVIGSIIVAIIGGIVSLMFTFAK